MAIAQTRAGEADQVEISHKEAVAAMRVMDPQQHWAVMTQYQQAVVLHFQKCHKCWELGIEKLLDLKLTHKEAILVWAENPHAFYLQGGTSFYIQAAIEHVWGRYMLKLPYAGAGYDHLTACPEECCQTLHRHWKGVLAEDAKGIVELFPTLVDIFVRQGWDLEELFKLQLERLKQVANAIGGDLSGVSHGHEYRQTDAVREIYINIQKLQEVIRQTP